MVLAGRLLLLHRCSYGATSDAETCCSACCAALLPCLQRLLKFVIAKVVFFACVGTSAYGSPMQASQLAGAGVLQGNSCCLPHDSSLWRLCPGLNRPPRAAPRHFLCSGWPGLR